MTHPTPWLDQPATLMPQDVRLMTMAFRIANRAVQSDIECNAVLVSLSDGYGRWLGWWDTRPMTDAREHCNEVVDMATEALAYAEQAGLIRRHETQPHMVRIVEGPDQDHRPGHAI